MDYLDPRKRRYYNLRLVIGYVLVAIVIGLATVIVVYGANGYGINTKTGQIVENGLLFVDSKPGGTEIFLNGKDKNTTAPARLILPAGNYTLTLKKAGYRDWSRSFSLDGQSVARYLYPFLFPVTPRVTTLTTYAAQPPLFSESPSRHWLLIEDSALSTLAPTFDQYDTTTLDNQTPTVTQASLPAAVLTNYASTDGLSVVEWSTDNNTVLLQHSYAGGSEFVVFNRAHPDQSYNVNTTFSVTPDQVNLYNKTTTQLYIHDSSDGSLRLANLADHSLGSPILKDVIAYKAYGKNLLLYITADNEPPGQVAARIWNNGQTYDLFELKAGSHYLIDLAQYQGHFYYFAGSDTEGRVNIYQDPLNDLTDPSKGKAVASLSLSLAGATIGGFSDNAQIIGIENGQNLAAYDIENNNVYNYTVSSPLSANLTWMDGNRLIGQTQDKVFITDFDGTNQQLLTATNLPSGGLFSGNYNHLLLLAPTAKAGNIALQDVDMRAGTDLPKK